MEFTSFFFTTHFSRYPKREEVIERKRLDQELNGLSLVSRDNTLFLELLSISFHYDDWKPVPDAVQSSRKCFLSAIVPFCGGGTLCERLYKGLSACAGDHMQSVAALQVTEMDQKCHLALGIAQAMCHCHALDIVHSDLCCCNILLTPNEDPKTKHIAPLSVKVANTGVLPDTDSLKQRRVYLAPELVSILNADSESATPTVSFHPSPSRSSPSHHSPHSPLLQSKCSAEGALHTSVPFTKASDVYALGITLLQLFRHTLEDCSPRICSAAADKSSNGLQVPLFPKASPSSSLPPLPGLLQNIVSSCTRRNPKDRPSAAAIRFATARCVFFLSCSEYFVSHKIVSVPILASFGISGILFMLPSLLELIGNCSNRQTWRSST
jgi:serine/threonine protein kinase